MKSFEQIAKAMYDAYRANHIHNLADWHQITQMNRDCWMDAAKAKALHQEILAAAPMGNQQSESLEIASQIELAITCGFIGSAAQYQHLLLSAVNQLRTLHARVADLEDHITTLTTWKKEDSLEVRGWKVMVEQERRIVELEAEAVEASHRLAVAHLRADQMESQHKQAAKIATAATKELATKSERIQELEAMLESVGAGGVSAQRVTQAADHIAQEPVAWRYQTSTGWHATTDASAALRVSKHHAIEPMYEAPQPQADALDAAAKGSNA